MGNSWRQPKQARAAERRALAEESKQKIAEATAHIDTTLAMPGATDLVNRLTAIAHTQLDRDGKPFTKNDLNAILIHFSLLRKKGAFRRSISGSPARTSGGASAQKYTPAKRRWRRSPR
jgi:hypothetical protein